MIEMTSPTSEVMNTSKIVSTGLLSRCHRSFSVTIMPNAKMHVMMSNSKARTKAIALPGGGRRLRRPRRLLAGGGGGLLGRLEDVVTDRTADLLAEHGLGQAESTLTRGAGSLKHDRLPRVRVDPLGQLSPDSMLRAGEPQAINHFSRRGNPTVADLWARPAYGRGTVEKHPCRPRRLAP